MSDCPTGPTNFDTTGVCMRNIDAPGDTDSKYMLCIVHHDMYNA